MGRQYSRHRKSLTPAQKDTLLHARAALALRSETIHGINRILASQQNLQRNSRAASNIAIYQQKAKAAVTKYRMHRKRTKRMEDAAVKHKVMLKQLKEENHRLRTEAERSEKVLKKTDEDLAAVIGSFEQRIAQLTRERSQLRHERSDLKKKCSHLRKIKQSLKRTHQTQARQRIFKLTNRGVYTKQSRELARYLVSVGTAEKKVGEAIATVGRMIGVEVDRTMATRTVQRAVLESGVAAEIQLGYEMAKSDKLTYSSDSTSHKHIEYESRTIALRVVDYTQPDAAPTWQMRTFGVDTSVNHTSQTQINGLQKRLSEIADTFNNSPLAKREGLKFCPGDFAFKLIGTSGDHAADQKRSHEILREWKSDTVLQRLGEEAIFNMGVTRVVSYLLPMKERQLETLGGYQIWEALSNDEKEKLDAQITREVGKEVFDALPLPDQERFMLFIRTGCCMHKDLNTVKGGDKAMQDFWKDGNKTPPILLANKDNSAVLAAVVSPSNLSVAERRAMEVSKCGGSHAAMLGGLICRNKDKKKGQQDTYNWFMEERLGKCVPYPDVSNTRYGTHGEAAATLVVYRKDFIAFMHFICDGKDKPGLTNIEKNFLKALEDDPTFTELCVLALYNVNVSRPFMRHVRQHDNLLDLGPFFEQKKEFLEVISNDPTQWIQQPQNSPDNFALDGAERDEWARSVLNSISESASSIPHLEGAITAFTKGALDTFSNRFSDEFLEGGDIDRLSADEKSELFFPSTNDCNEGALGSWRLGQRHRPSETIHKFNAGFTSKRNDTEIFHREKLTTEEDEAYLRKRARDIDSEKRQRQIQEAQMKADSEKVAENRQKDVVRKEKQTRKATTITETGKNLKLDDYSIVGLNNEDLNRQLDWHRENEKKVPNLPQYVPLKSHMKSKSARVTALKDAVERYKTIAGLQDTVTGAAEAEKDNQIPDDTFYQSDYNDDMA